MTHSPLASVGGQGNVILTIFIMKIINSLKSNSAAELILTRHGKIKRSRSRRIIAVFLKLVRALNKMDIVPIIYGSLGLSLLVGECGPIADIDFILTDAGFRRRWRDIQNYLISKMGYKKDPDHKQEFLGNGCPVSFLKLSDIKTLIPIRLSQLTKHTREGGTYYNLTLSLYLGIYRKGLRGRDRKQKKEGPDKEKIRLIEKHLTMETQ